MILAFVLSSFIIFACFMQSWKINKLVRISNFARVGVFKKDAVGYNMLQITLDVGGFAEVSSCYEDPCMTKTKSTNVTCAILKLHTSILCPGMSKQFMTGPRITCVNIVIKALDSRLR